jgi:hypothetical protein
MAALVASWIYGAQALSEGYEGIAYYRGERPDVHAIADAITDTAARDAAIAAGDRWLAVRDEERGKEFPVGVASLLLGAVMVLFAARSMAGREGARSKLVQVVLVHAGLVVAGFGLTTQAARAEVEFHLRVSEAQTHVPADPVATQRAREYMEIIAPAVAPLFVAIRTLMSGLIILALTRPRSRAFFSEAAPGPLGEG